MGGHTMREGLTEERPHCPPPRLCAWAGRVSALGRSTAVGGYCLWGVALQVSCYSCLIRDISCCFCSSGMLARSMLWTSLP